MSPKSVLLQLHVNCPDIGSNIGTYTVPVAAMGRSVVAVDMMLDNLGYIRTSLDTMDTASKVELVHNAVR